MTKNVSHSGEVLAEVIRNEVVESIHSGHLIALSADGSTLFSKGDPTKLVFPRSAIKGIQASAMVRAGLDLDPKLLALVCASHSGSLIHQAAALEILRAAALDESALLNGRDRPLGVEEGRAWGEKSATSLAHNCSGKHSGMLYTCIINNWSIENYLDPEHPLQLACRRELECLAEEEVSKTSVDGCGAPLFLLSLAGIVRAIRNLTISRDPIHRAVMAACRNYPEMVAGENRLTTRLMREFDGLFLKEGAEGVEVGSLPDGRAFAFKVSDGSGRAHEPIVKSILERFGVTVLTHITPIFGGNQVIGSVRANF